MTVDRKTSKGLAASLLLISVLGGNMAQAGKVTIINESKQNIRVDVIPQPGSASYCKKCFDGRTDPCGKNAATINVPTEACKLSPCFSLVDVGNGLMGGGKCKSLNAAKNYEVIFFETALGTDCVSREI